MFPIDSFAKHVYYVIVVFVVVCILFCVVQKKEGVETRVVIDYSWKGQDGQNQCFYLYFPLTSGKR